MVLDMEDLAQQMGKESEAPQSPGIAQDQDKQQRTARSNRVHCVGNWIARREKERDLGDALSVRGR